MTWTQQGVKQEREHTDMPTALHVSIHMHVNPALDIQHPPFQNSTMAGYTGRSSRSDRYTSMAEGYTLKCVKESLTDTDVDGQQGFWRPLIGFPFWQTPRSDPICTNRQLSTGHDCACPL